MSFKTFLELAIGFISLANGSISLYKSFTDNQKKKEIDKRDWNNYTERFRTYVKKHPEIGIVIIPPKKVGLSTEYLFISNNEEENK